MENKKIEDLEATTIILMIINIFLYEVCYCNFNSLIGNEEYSFSLFRIVMYITFIAVYIIFSHKFTEEARKTLNAKRKLIYWYLATSTMYLIYKIVTGMYMHSLILLLLILSNGLIFLLYITKDYAKNIFVTIFTIGFICIICTNTYHDIDDKKHFLSALNVAVGNINFIQNPQTNKQFNDIPFNMSSERFAEEYFNKKSSFDMENIPEDESVFSTPSEYSSILYLPSSIGINIARFLGGSIADVYISGRIFNMITYGVLLAIMLKILPFKKKIFYVIYLLPTSFVLAGSYSIDGITVGLIGIFIAYTFKLYKDNYKNIKLKQFIILLLLFLLTLICKSGAYIGIASIVFLLPVFKIIKDNKKIRIAVIIVLLIALLVVLFQTIKMARLEVGDVRSGDTSPSRQIEFLLQNPMNILKVYKNFIRVTILNLSWYANLNLPFFYTKNFIITTSLFTILVLDISITDTSYTFNKKEKIITAITFFTIYFITSFILYLSCTEVGKLNISGYQARYLIPALPLVLCNMNSKRIQNSVEEQIYCKTGTITGLLLITDVIFMII